MPNDCIIAISRGKNKGKKCKDVKTICRHQKNKCAKCGEIFSYKHTLTAHSRICVNECKRKKVLVIKKPNMMERLSTLEQRNRDLEFKVEKVEQQPRVNNIMVIGNDFFEELVTKFGGKDAAVDFLTLAATSGKAIDVIDKLYLEGKDPMAYPIACRDDDHFRFRRLEGEKVIDDQGGTMIGDLMMDRLCNAFLMAANELISKHVEEGESNPSALHAQAQVQRSISSVCDKRNIVYQLAAATHNSNHPFFRDEDDE
jgi:hypothetical protein